MHTTTCRTPMSGAVLRGLEVVAEPKGKVALAQLKTQITIKGSAVRQYTPGTRALFLAFTLPAAGITIQIKLLFALPTAFYRFGRVKLSLQSDFSGPKHPIQKEDVPPNYAKRDITINSFLFLAGSALAELSASGQKIAALLRVGVISSRETQHKHQPMTLALKIDQQHGIATHRQITADVQIWGQFFPVPCVKATAAQYRLFPQVLPETSPRLSDAGKWPDLLFASMSWAALSPHPP